MPRSSRHKPSKNGARDSREYSGSEDDLGVKERKGVNEDDGGSVRVSKGSVLGEKRKLDSKESRRDTYDAGTGCGDCAEDYGNSSSRRRKEKGSGDGVNGRWNGGSESVDERDEGLKKARGSCDSKSSSRRREDEADEVKRSGGRSEKHSSRESSRKVGKDKERDRDRDREKRKEKDRERVKDKERERGSEKKGKVGKGDKFGDNEDERSSSMREITTDDVLERRNRKRSENADVYQDEIGDVKNKHSSFVDDFVKDMRKDDKRRDEKYREKFRDEEEKSRHDKYKDEYPVEDRSRSRSREKYSRDGKDHKDVKQKMKKLADGDQENGSRLSYDHSRSRDRDRERNRVGVHDGDRKHDQVSDRERDRDLLPEKEREHDWDCDRERERERDHVHEQGPDVGLDDERGSRSKDRYNYVDSKVKDDKDLNTDLDKTSLSSSRVEAESKGDRSSRPAYFDVSPSNNRSQVSPTSSSHGGDDGFRYARNEDPKYRDLQMENRLKVNSGRTSERSSKHRSSEKHDKAGDEPVELTGERPSSSKPSPMGLTDGSSSPSLDRRYKNRSVVRRSLDVDDTGRKSSASTGSRDFSGADVKSGRDIDVYKSVDEESSQADSSFNSRQCQSNGNPLPPFRPGVESPTFTGMMEEESRPNSNSRYKRTCGPGIGRGRMNSWRGGPNWSSPLPNGFIPFQSGPPHGNFQSMIPHFPPPHIFGVRPPMEINQPGLPFPFADADRFPGHLRPLGWPSMMDPSVTPHLHGWDVNSGVLRGEPHFFGHDWEHNRHPITAREWESNVDTWKGHNGISADAPSVTSKDSSGAQFPIEDGFPGHGNRKSNNENSHEVGELKSAENRNVLTPEKKALIEFPIKKRVSSKSAEIDSLQRISKFYLSRLDISEQLVHRKVYKQCVDLLDGKPGLTMATHPLMHMILTNDRRKGLRASDDFLSSSVLPSTDDSSFQKALELYKSQRLEIRDTAMVKVDPLFSILATSSSEDMNQEVAAMENEEKPSLDADGGAMPQSSHLTSDQDRIIDDALTVKHEPVDDPSLEPNNAEPPELHTEVVEKLGISSTCPANHVETFDDIPHAKPAQIDVPLDAAEFEMSSVEVGNDSVVGDNPSVACEVSNESELVSHGRIHHHSPGSSQ